MKNFSLLIKPASADCNLRCEYCFYLGHRDFYPDRKGKHMSDETLERVISSFLRTEQDEYIFGWQGGEPILMGADFFRRVIELQQRHGRAGAVIGNGLQTNATLITGEMAALFKQFSFLLGVSLDGPADIHDMYRKSSAGAGSHEDVMRGINTLREHEVDFNILTLVSRSNATRAGEVYRYLVDSGFMYHQYIPCVEMGDNGVPAPFAVGGEEWGEFLCAIFDQWEKTDTRRVSVRLFDAVLSRIVDGRETVCHLGTDCRKYFLVEYNGDVYPCDFFVDAGLKLGNINETGWRELSALPLYEEFGLRKNNYADSCGGCEWVDICAADCMKHRINGAGVADHREVSVLCPGWDRFFAHSLPRFRELADEIRAERRGNVRRAIERGEVNPARNDSCPCGSEKKFKKCCGAA